MLNVEKTLLTFFSLFLLSLWICMEISGNSSAFGCVGNLFKSSKDLTGTEVSASNSVLLPHYYRCQNQLLNIITEQPEPLERASDKEPLVLIDPKSHEHDKSTEGSGLVKRDTKFTVSDDLIITPMNSSSAFCLLKKLQTQAEDLMVQEISITKTEATSLLRASLMTCSALSAALRDLIIKEAKGRDLKKQSWRRL